MLSFVPYRFEIKKWIKMRIKVKFGNKEKGTHFYRLSNSIYTDIYA